MSISAEELENEAREESGLDGLCLKLYISGMAPNSLRAVKNLKEFCDKYLNDKAYKLDIVDIYQYPEMAKGENIIVTPTLLRKNPVPELRIVGDLSVHGRVLDLITGII